MREAHKESKVLLVVSLLQRGWPDCQVKEQVQSKQILKISFNAYLNASPEGLNATR